MAVLGALSAIGTIVAGGVSVASGISQANAIREQATRSRQAAERKAGLLTEQAFFIKQTTIEEVESYKRAADKLVGESIVTIGASGFRFQGATGEILRSNAESIQRDIELIKLRGTREAQVLVKEAQGLIESGVDISAAGEGLATGALLSGLAGGAASIGGAFIALKRRT